MKQLRTLLVGAALSLTLLGGAAGAVDAQGPSPFGQVCVSQLAQMGDQVGVGPHIQGMHSGSQEQEMSVGAHLQMMRTGNMGESHHDMDMSMCEMDAET